MNAKDAHRAAIALGCCLLVVTLANLVLVWKDVELGAPQWELAATSQSFERVPMVLLSLFLVGVGGLVGGSVAVVRTSAVLFALSSLAVLGLALLYALGVLQAYQSIPMLARGAFRASAVKNIVATGAFILTSGYLSALLWRRVVKGSQVQPEGGSA